MENTKKTENDAVKVDQAAEKKQPATPPNTGSYPSDWTLNTVKGMWGNKHNNTIMLMGKF